LAALPTAEFTLPLPSLSPTDSKSINSRRAGDRSVSGKDLSTTVGAEYIGEIAEYDGGRNLALGSIVGGRDPTISNEEKILCLPSFDLALEGLPVRMNDEGREQNVVAALSFGCVSDQRSFDICSPLVDHDCPAEVVTNFRGEEGVAIIDGVLDVAQDIGEEDLVGLDEVLLSGVAVEHPDTGAIIAHQISATLFSWWGAILCSPAQSEANTNCEWMVSSPILNLAHNPRNSDTRMICRALDLRIATWAKAGKSADSCLNCSFIKPKPTLGAR
jgi:hypothetical protein